MSTSGHLTKEILDEAFAQMKRRDEEEARRYAKRVREVAARGPHRSALGQIIDSVYIKCGPIIVSPQVARVLEEQLESAEAEARRRERERP